MDKISDKLDTISERLYTVENKMSYNMYIEKQLYLWKLHEQTSNKPQYAPRTQQISQYVAPISRKTHQLPIMNPYFKPPRYKKHVNEPQAATQHTKHTATTHQLISARCSITTTCTTCATHYAHYTSGGFLIRRSSAIRRFFAGFLRCDLRTIMRSFLK